MATTNSGITIDRSTLDQWVQNFQGNKDLPFTTNNALISLAQLENFIAEAKQKNPACNAIKVCFIRYVLKEPTPYFQIDNDRYLSAPSLAFVPLANVDVQTWTWENASGGEVFLLPFCNPENPADNVDETGVCPPKCGIQRPAPTIS